MGFKWCMLIFMLYQFKSKNSANCLMLQDLSIRIFGILERELEPKGILLVDQLPKLIQKLEDAIAQDALSRESTDQDNTKTQIDRLGARAYPFLTLLKSALKYQNPIVWGV